MGASKDVVAGSNPAGTEELAHLREPGGFGGDRSTQLRDATPGAVVDLVAANEHVREHLMEARVVQLGATLVAVSRNDHRGGLDGRPAGGFGADKPSTSFCSWPSRAFQTTRYRERREKKNWCVIR